LSLKDIILSIEGSNQFIKEPYHFVENSDLFKHYSYLSEKDSDLSIEEVISL